MRDKVAMVARRAGWGGLGGYGPIAGSAQHYPWRKSGNRPRCQASTSFSRGLHWAVVRIVRATVRGEVEGGGGVAPWSLGPRRHWCSWRCVVTAGYRRGFHAAATAIAQAARQLPVDELFSHLVAVGRAQRTATERWQHISTALDASRIP